MENVSSGTVVVSTGWINGGDDSIVTMVYKGYIARSVVVVVASANTNARDTTAKSVKSWKY
jgi:hypothetical protein